MAAQERRIIGPASLLHLAKLGVVVVCLVLLQEVSLFLYSLSVCDSQEFLHFCNFGESLSFCNPFFFAIFESSNLYKSVAFTFLRRFRCLSGWGSNVAVSC